MGTLTVCQWNIHKCLGSDGQTSCARTGDALAAIGADVYTLNEVYFYWGSRPNLNMAVYLRDYLAKALGGTWFVEWYNARGLTLTSGYGGAILSRLPLVYVHKRLLTPGASNLKGGPRGAIKASVNADGTGVVIVCTHLEYYDDAARTKEIHELGAWLPQFPAPHVVCGDFNTRPGSADYTRFRGYGYSDGWAGAGTPVSPWPSGNTQGYRCPDGGGSRFDYGWLKGRLRPTRVEVKDMRVGGVWPSDHHPLVLTLAT